MVRIEQDNEIDDIDIIFSVVRPYPLSMESTYQLIDIFHGYYVLFKWTKVNELLVASMVRTPTFDYCLRGVYVTHALIRRPACNFTVQAEETCRLDIATSPNLVGAITRATWSSSSLTTTRHGNSAREGGRERERTVSVGWGWPPPVSSGNPLVVPMA